MSKVRNILSAVFVLAFLVSSMAVAEPLPGQILKFQQDPMITTTVDGAVYYGHDELSMLYDFSGTGEYEGVAMADDFADKFDTPVVHVRWWGSYLSNEIGSSVSKFLIAFESDVPAVVGDADSFSHPDQVLLSQVVTVGPLTPGSGTFTEKLVFSPDPAFGDDVYVYNAELKLPFNQQADTVYWLKIAALVDDFTDSPRWGWHNRDYTTTNGLFGAAIPGERDEQPLIDPAYPSKVWHFQDDAVSAQTSYVLNADGTWSLTQTGYVPQNYIDGVDGPGPGLNSAGLDHEGIGQFSKDLAFELYTIPEPATLGLLLVGGLLGLTRRFR